MRQRDADAAVAAIGQQQIDQRHQLGERDEGLDARIGRHVKAQLRRRRAAGGGDHQHVVVGQRLQRRLQQLAGIGGNRALGHQHHRLAAIGQLTPPGRQRALRARLGQQRADEVHLWRQVAARVFEIGNRRLQVQVGRRRGPERKDRPAMVRGSGVVVLLHVAEDQPVHQLVQQPVAQPAEACGAGQQAQAEGRDIVARQRQHRDVQRRPRQAVLVAEDLGRGHAAVGQQHVGAEAALDRAQVLQVAGDRVDEDMLEVEAQLRQALESGAFAEVAVVVGIAEIQRAADRLETRAAGFDAGLHEAAAVPDHLMSLLDQPAHHRLQRQHVARNRHRRHQKLGHCSVTPRRRRARRHPA